MLGLLAWIPGVRVVFAVAGICLAIRATVWHVLRRKRFVLDRQLVQARRGLAGSGWFGTAYFGWILGLTVVTEMMTPVVQATAVLCAAGGPAFGLAVGAGLGLARSVDPWRGALATAVPAPAAVLDRYIAMSTRPVFHIGGVAISTVLIYLSITWMMKG